MAWPVVIGALLTTPEIGARTSPRSNSALASASSASAERRSASSWFLSLAATMPRLISLQLRVEVGLALLHQRLGLIDLRLPRFVGKRGDHVAFLHHVAATAH